MKKRHIGTKTLAKLTLGVLLLVIISIQLWKWISSPVDLDNQEKIQFSIESGATLDEIADSLKQTDLIRSKAAFKLAVIKLGLVKHIQAGEFLLSPSWTTEEIVQSLTLGRSDVRVTLIEGWRREEIAEEFSQQLSGQGAQFDKNEFLRLTEGKEGRLFPDTYFIPVSSSSPEIVELLIVTFTKKVDPITREQINNQGLTLDEGLIIASMVEREARFSEDRPIVAGILIKRWKNGWPLEVDATIQYALGFQSAEKSWWKKNLTRKDLKVESPYNTYIKNGLPLAPICNPSLDSIKAVANQRQTDYWFYLSDKQGKLHFAETLEKHNTNISKYLIN